MFHISTLVKLFSIRHKEFKIVHIFQTIKVLSYTALVLTITRAIARQYQEHLDEIKSRQIHKLIAHKKNVMDLAALGRSSSSLSSYYTKNTSQQDITSSNIVGSFSYSPLNKWTLKAIRHFKLLFGIVAKRQRMTISLKNTILWNPSKDINSPVHAFNENAILLLSRLSQVYNVHIITSTNTSVEKKQIQGLLRKAHITRSEYLKSGNMIDQVHYCKNEKEKVELLKQLKPSIHVEGGSEMEDGQFIVGQIRNDINSVKKLIWIISNQKRKSSYQDEILELTDNITHSSIAKDLGF